MASPIANDDQPVPNRALRDHVTDHSFVLALRKTHIATLAQLAHGERDPSRLPGVPDYFVTASHALIRRGLLAHRHSPDFLGRHGGAVDPITNYYRLARAGWAVFDLLVEAGLAADIEQKSSKRKLVA